MSREFAALGARVEARVANRTHLAAFRREVRRQMDRNMEILASRGMFERPYLTREMFVELADLDANELKAAYRRTDAHYIRSLHANHDYMRMTLVIRAMEKVHGREAADHAAMYAACCMYAMIHRKFYPIGHGDERTMEWVVNSLSRKFDIGRLGLLGTLRKIAESHHAKARRDLLSDDDQKICNYLQNMRTRINGMVKTFADKFYKAFERRERVDVTKGHEARKGDDGAYFPDRESDSQAVEGAARTFALHFATNPVDRQMARAAAGAYNRVVETTFRRTLEDVKASEGAGVPDLAREVFALHAEKRGGMEGVCNRRWIPFTMRLCSGSNVRNPHILRTRELIHGMLERRCPLYAKTRQEKTRTAYRNALLFYFLMHMQRQRCG